MTDALTGDARHAQPVPVDLADIQTGHTDPETPEQLLSTTVAETAAGVTGVHHLGGLASRALDRASRRILGTSTVPGVTVSRADGGTIVDVDLVVEYPHTISTVMESVRTQVARAAAQLVSGPVAVNVTVTDVHGPFDRVAPVNEQIDPAESLAARASAAADTVKSRVSDAASATAGALSSATDAAAGALSDARDATADAVDRASDATADAVNRATEAASSATDAAAEAVSSAADGAKARAADAVAAAADTVSDAADTLADETDAAVGELSDTDAAQAGAEHSVAAQPEPTQSPVIVVIPVVVEASEVSQTGEASEADSHEAAADSHEAEQRS